MSETIKPFLKIFWKRECSGGFWYGQSPRAASGGAGRTQKLENQIYPSAAPKQVCFYVWKNLDCVQIYILSLFVKNGLKKFICFFYFAIS